MFKHTREVVFSLYERPVLRNWFYTLAFAVFVPVGLRFAILAWRFGGDVDRLLTIIAGMTIGITTAVTLLRIWTVPPRRTVPRNPEHELHGSSGEIAPTAGQIMAAVRGYSARNLQMAQGARALGAPRRLPR